LTRLRTLGTIAAMPRLQSHWPSALSHTRRALALIALGGALLIAGCGGGDGSTADSDPPAASSADSSSTTVADSEPSPAAEDEPAAPPALADKQDQAEIEALVRDFFEALIAGDADDVWSLISSDLQSQVERSDVQESVALVAQSYDDPGFQFNSFLSFESDGQRAEFLIDGFTTESGVRVGTAAQAAQSPPLHAVYEGDRWRIEPELSLLRLNQTQVNVDG